eukprot:CAMPEP_0197726918 /NCGR_PEP_ID=MMETSP1434-20131217/17688_1 /TAXON_ID=265543 /ORGANISM="Minutocellus polymorphus, Strain CCMP3303" /LENGTH=360 /DNA_ID=CAMNT_0043312973 /DNA_START=115 /DNA_END=1197 /DNA_ORIENTATION=+
MSTPDVAGFLTGTAMFFVLKLTTSVDDILWLSPFLAMSDGDMAYRFHCGLLYAAICLLVTMEALIIKVAANYGFEALLQAFTPGHDGDDSKGGNEDEDEPYMYWTAPRLLCILASICIAAFALNEWKVGREDENDGENDDNACHDNTGKRKDVVESTRPIEDDEVPTIQTSQLSDSRRSSHSSDGEYKSFASVRKVGSQFDDEEAQQVHEDRQGHQLVEEGISMNHLPSHVQVRQVSNYESLPSVDTDAGDFNNGEDKINLQHESEKEEVAAEKHTLWTLLVVAFFGTLDDLALFSAVLMGRSIQYSSLLCGSMLAAAFIVLISWGVSMVTPFKKAIKRIPLWGVLLAISLYILLDGLLG